MTSPSRGGGKTEDTDNKLGGGQEAEEGGGGEVSPGPGREAGCQETSWMPHPVFWLSQRKFFPVPPWGD